MSYDELEVGMLRGWSSALLLAAALSVTHRACSHKAPSPAVPASAELVAEPPVPPPIAPLPPIQVSPWSRTASTVSAREYDAFSVSIPGVLAVRPPALDVQSHGVGEEPWRATFLVTNETMAPLSVRVSELTLRTDEVMVPLEYRTQAVAVKSASADGIGARVEGGAVTFTVSPRRQIEVELDGDLGQNLRVYYKQSYRHEAVFSVGEASVVGRGFTMYFRYPHLIGK
jgi:hypothetical protein